MTEVVKKNKGGRPKKTESYNFKMFYADWINRYGWRTPAAQSEVINWLDSKKKWKNNTKVLLVWRGFGKSTIVDLWIAYKLSKDPTLRILLMSADKTVAKKTTRNVRNILRHHPRCAHINPDHGDKLDQSDQFFVVGAQDDRNPSLSAYGIQSNVTAGRADVIVYDDVEVGKNSGTEHKREQLRDRIQETKNLLTPGGIKLFIGTYHDYESIYDEEIASGAEYYKRPILENPKGEFPFITGDYVWESRFGEEFVLDKQKSSSSKNNFYSQYLLEPRPVTDCRLDPILITRYYDECDYTYANRRLYTRIGERSMKSVTVWWDPAFSETSPDDSVVAVVYTDHDGYYWIHRVKELRGNVEKQVLQIREFMKENKLPTLYYESNGIGGTLEHMLIKYLSGIGVGVIPVHTAKNKNQKIIESLEVPLSAGLVYAHDSVMISKFANQLRDFSPIATRQKDDYIDAVASAILQEPIRIASTKVTMEGDIDVQSFAHDASFEIPPLELEF